MSDDPTHDRNQTRQMRVVSLVIAGTMVLWMIAQWAVGEFGISSRYRLLIDLFALAGFLWAFIVTWQIWRKRRG